VASVRYREDASARLKLLMNTMKSKYGDHMAGYHPSGQSAGNGNILGMLTGY